MTLQPESSDLTGTFLIAMPGMGDPRFDKSVVLMCAHSPEAAMGLIVNKPLPGVDLGDLLGQLKVARAPHALSPVVHFGGPVESSRGFVLHEGAYEKGDATMQVPGGFGMTATLDVLHDMAAGQGPGKALLALGYAGWGAGQIEREILQNGWLTVKAQPRIVFDMANNTKWEAALALLGVDPLTLSATAGRA